MNKHNSFSVSAKHLTIQVAPLLHPNLLQAVISLVLFGGNKTRYHKTPCNWSPELRQISPKEI